MTERLKSGAESLPLASREPLIVLPDGRRIGLFSANHGKVNKEERTYGPFTDRVLTESEIAEVFPAGADCLVSDSFPGAKLLTQDMVNQALATANPALHIHAWAVKYAASHDLTIIQADPVAYSRELQKLVDRELSEAQIKLTEADLEYYLRQAGVENDPRYQELKLRLVAATGLEVGADLLFLLSALGALDKALEIGNSGLNRRQFLKFVGLAAAAGATASFSQKLQSLETLLSNQKFEVLLQLRKALGLTPPSIQRDIDLQHILRIFSQDKELGPADFADQATQRRMETNRNNLPITVGLRNALIARNLTLPKSAIAPWVTKDRLDIAVVVGHDHTIFPENMRILYYLLHPEDTDALIKKQSNSLLADLKTGHSFKINPDGSLAEATFNPFMLAEFN